MTLLGATAIDDKLQDEVPETIEQQLEALSIALMMCWMMRDEIFFWLICFFAFCVFPGIANFLYVHVSPDLFGFPCFSYSHFVPLTCCNQGSDRQEYVLLGRIHGLVRGKDVRIVRYNLEISFEIGVTESGFAPKKQLETACNLLGLRFGCSLVTRSTQPSVLPCRASCSRKK